MVKQVNPSSKSFQWKFLGRGTNKWQEAEDILSNTRMSAPASNPFALPSIHPSVYLSSAPVPSFASSSASASSTVRPTRQRRGIPSKTRPSSLTSSQPCHSISISPLFNTLFLFPKTSFASITLSVGGGWMIRWRPQFSHIANEKWLALVQSSHNICTFNIFPWHYPVKYNRTDISLLPDPLKTPYPHQCLRGSVICNLITLFNQFL